ncbi:alpha/beta fold hydrolase [Aeromicrobium fastidiosum]|uniref:Alpha/beta hydrolase n=1 Tax=Aeromicrobium fastidiosum TaxID=52699 RepID=A0A641APR7_9ACTN|nr:alpha/beta hydrolase [Aeromicrobium fastidiosum]KAA1379929.1 alpha/beta hydrolase [Aeromicrobium fastidiosum]MBP2389435.1 pimeloyl-ACP methyl ester carboxylesterase [Aeromicrobium fastidiosum]
MTEHHIEVEDGVSLFVQDVGHGRPVVFLHGWALGHELWDRQVHELATHGRRAVALDLRGHGASSKPLTGYGVERLAADVIAVIESLELEKIVLVGWSIGGLTAFRVAAERPDLLERLVLVGSNGVAASKVPGLPFGAPAASVEGPVIAAELADRVASREGHIRRTVLPTVSDSTLQWLLALTMRVPVWAGVDGLKTILNTDQVSAAATLAVPLVQIIGDQDPTLSARAAQWLIDTVPDARQLTVPDSGHFPMVENAEVFASTLLAAVSIDQGS